MRVVQGLDRESWHEFIAGTPGAGIFHTPEMYEVFAQAHGYEPELWATIGRNDRPLALFAPVRITLMGGPLGLLTSRAVAYGSALCPWGSEGPAALGLLLRAYNQATPGRVIFTELRNTTDLPWARPALEANGFRFEDHLNFLIDLQRPEADLWRSIRSSARRNIHKAETMGVVVEEVTNLSGLTPVYSVLKAVYRRLQVPLPGESLFRAAFATLYPRGMMRIILASVDETPIGALTLLIHRDVMTYWYTGTLRAFSDFRPADLLVWRALQLGAAAGCRVFDFGGGGRPDEAYGVRDFKAKFGGELVNYGRYVRVHAPRRLRVSQTGYQLVRRFL